MNEYVLDQEVDKLSVEDMKIAYYELKELSKTGILVSGIVRDILRKSQLQNPSLSITGAQLVIYEKLIEKLLGGIHHGTQNKI